MYQVMGVFIHAQSVFLPDTTQSITRTQKTPAEA
jgi:hypothetical protein